MSKQQETARLSMEIPVKLKKQLKTIAAINDTTITQLVLSCLGEYLFSKNIPNKETLKAFEETDKGKGLIACEDVDDLFNKLGLNE